MIKAGIHPESSPGQAFSDHAPKKGSNKKLPVGGCMSFFQIFDLTNEFNILRLICGLFLLPHFYAKASDLELTYKIYDDYRLYPVKAWVYSCMVIEIVCAIGMVFAIYTRYVASLEAVFLFVAAWATWRYSK